MHDRIGCLSSEKRLKWAAIASAIFCACVLIQITFILVRGAPLCLNTGCRVVEELVELNPILFNLLGAAFFASCAVTAALGRKHPLFCTLFQVLCLGGFAAEGILFSYQAFVAGTWCSYCLMVLGAVVIINAIAGIRQLFAGLSILLVEVLLFSLLNFNISTGKIQTLTLDNGTCAITRCEKPARTLYLIFSQDCPHCHKVLEALTGCSQCEFHFNPIKKIRKGLLPGTVPQEKYMPEINRLALSILGIDSIPVLLVKRRDGYLLIKGDHEIIAYIRSHCSPQAPAHDIQQESNEKSNKNDAGDVFLQETAPDFLQPDDSDGACSLENGCNEQ